MEYRYLNKVNSPEDIKTLSEAEILALSDEIRDFLIEKVGKNGGHLASNLGVVELTLAIHKVFDSPKDHIIFDVGHQSYVHKILTGRKDSFDSLRKTGGLSGFTKMSESVHDAFGAGHSSTSVSAALGYAEADRLNANDAYTVAVLGDGAYTGGMIHEAINNCDPDLKLIIILNENGMSISVNKGSFARYLSGVRMSKGYRGWKKNTNSLLSHIPLLGKPIKSFLTFVKEKFKNMFFSSNYFEDLGLYYIGPIDGNNFRKVEKTLKKAKSLGKSVIVHTKTVKGKGYEPAESSPEGFHSLSASSSVQSTFHSVAAQELINLAKEDPKILAITPAMGVGTGLDTFGAAFPDRFFDVGIAEEHAITFAAGLAASKNKPFVSIYSTFLQRAYDSVIHDVALQRLPVKLLVDRAGLALKDGATHHGIFDVAYLSHIPNVEIISPITYSALRKAVRYAYESDIAVAVRYPNRSESETVVREFYSEGVEELSYKMNFSKDKVPDKIFITYGTAVENVLSARDLIRSEGDEVGVILLEILKPYEKFASEFFDILNQSKKVVFVEEGIRNGGAGMLLYDALSRINKEKKFDYKICAIDDNFAAPEYPCDLLDYVGLSPEKIAANFR